MTLLDTEQLRSVIEKQEAPLVDSRTLGLPKPLFRGKVRDTYDAGKNRLLIIATDRISVFDEVLLGGVIGKGVILNQMSARWFEMTKNEADNHFLSIDLNDFPEQFRIPELAHRSMLVEKFEVLPAECIVRNNLTGSAWAEYQKSGKVLGHKFKKPLQESQAFDSPLFTPSTKEETGHDQNITFKQMKDRFIKKYGEDQGIWLAGKCKTLSLATFNKAAKYALSKGIIIADSKFEFGIDQHGYIFLIDEALTPDSSRFWAAENFQLGKPQDSFDKQFVRNWATRIGWNKTLPAPVLPDVIADKTQQKYLEVFSRLFA